MCLANLCMSTLSAALISDILLLLCNFFIKTVFFPLQTSPRCCKISFLSTNTWGIHFNWPFPLNLDKLIDLIPYPKLSVSKNVFPVDVNQLVLQVFTDAAFEMIKLNEDLPLELFSLIVVVLSFIIQRLRHWLPIVLMKLNSLLLLLLINLPDICVVYWNNLTRNKLNQQTSILTIFLPWKSSTISAPQPNSLIIWIWDSFQFRTGEKLKTSLWSIFLVF